MMKLSVTYLYTIFRYGYPPAMEDDFRALAEIEKMGFQFLEMEALGGAHAQRVWDNREELRRRLDGHGIHVHNFCAVDPDLVSLDAARRRAAIEKFRRTAELGAFLGAETLHLASYAPPVIYPDKSPYAIGDDYTFENAFALRIPEGFCWGRVWETLVESCQELSEIAAGFGRTVIMEPRVGEVICSVDSMIRLIADVGRPNFKGNFDTGHFSAQRENVSLALMKLEGQFANIHVSDNTPRDADHLPIGEGDIDWLEFFRILGRQGYDGYLGLDFGRKETFAADLMASRDKLRQFATQAGAALHW